MKLPRKGKEGKKGKKLRKTRPVSILFWLYFGCCSKFNQNKKQLLFCKNGYGHFLLKVDEPIAKCNCIKTGLKPVSRTAQREGGKEGHHH